MQQFILSRRNSLEAKINAELLTAGEKAIEEEQIRILERYLQAIREKHITDIADGIRLILRMFGELCQDRKKKLEKTKKMLENGFLFLEKCFGEGQELLLFETSLTADDRINTFIAEYGCDSYFRHCDLILYQKQEQKLREECRKVLEEVKCEDYQK